MLLLILAIAAIFGTIISSSKSIKYLKAEDTKESKKWGLFAVGIVLTYLIFAWIYKSIKTDAFKVGDVIKITVNNDVTIGDKKILKNDSVTGTLMTEGATYYQIKIDNKLHEIDKKYILKIEN